MNKRKHLSIRLNYYVADFLPCDIADTKYYIVYVYEMAF